MTASFLVVQHAKPSDSGTYSCAPSLGDQVAVNVHVLRGKLRNTIFEKYFNFEIFRRIHCKIGHQRSPSTDPNNFRICDPPTLDVSFSMSQERDLNPGLTLWTKLWFERKSSWRKLFFFCEHYTCSSKWTESFIKDSKGLVSKPSKKKEDKKSVWKEQRRILKNPLKNLQQLFSLALVAAQRLTKPPSATLIIYYVVWKQTVDENKDQLFLCYKMVVAERKNGDKMACKLLEGKQHFQGNGTTLSHIICQPETYFLPP